MREKVRHAMRAHRRQRRIELPGGEMPHFVERARRQHRLESPIDAGIEHMPFRCQEDAQTLRDVEQRRAAPRLEIARAADASPRTLRARAECAADRWACSRAAVSGSAAASLCMQGLGRQARGRRPHPRAHLGRHARNVGETLRQRLEIEPRAADEQSAGARFAAPLRALPRQRRASGRRNNFPPRRHGRRDDAAAASPRPRSAAP